MTIDTAFIHFLSLSTTRLQLRQIQPGDAEAIFTTFSDEEIMKFYGQPHQSLSDSQRLIERIQAGYVGRESIHWGITLKGDDRVIGSCCFHRLDANAHHAETGYELNRAFWGQGIMFEAMSAILSYGFNEMELHRIEAVIDDANVRSKGLLLKLGFTYEGNLRQRYFFRGRFEDEHYFGLLREEWDKLYINK